MVVTFKITNELEKSFFNACLGESDSGNIAEF